MDVKSLLNRPPIYSGESLSSYLHRIAKANLLEVRHIDTLVKKLISDDDNYTHPSKGKTYSILSDLTGLEPYKLYWASTHSLAPILVDEVQLNEKIVLDSGFSFAKMPDKFDTLHLRPTSNSQYCPDCLKEGSYERKVWRSRIVSVCPEHKRVLIDKCPICANRLRDTAIAEATCTQCGFNLIKAPAYDLSEDIHGLKTQAALYHWLNAGPHTSLSIPNFSGQHLYQLVTTLMLEIRIVKHRMEGLHLTPELSRPIRWGKKHWASPTHTYIAWVTAFDALLDWPNGLYRTIENIFRADSGEFSTDFSIRLGNYLGNLLEKWPKSKSEGINWAIERYLFQKSTWYFTQRRGSLLDSDIEITEKHPMFNNFQWLLDEHAAQYLNLNLAMLDLLVEQEILRVNSSFKYLEHKFLSCISVLFLRDIWAEVVSIRHTSLILGLKHETIFKLNHAGMLEPCRGTYFTGQTVAGVTKESIDKLLDRFVDLSMASKVTSKVCMSLNDAVEMLLFWGYEEIHLLILALEGKLPCRFTHNMLLGDIEFLQSSLFELAQSNARGEYITMAEFSRKIGVPRKFFTELIASSLLTANIIDYRYVSYIPKKEAEEFDKKYISMKNAKKLTKFVKGKFETLISAHAIAPVSGPDINGLSEYLFLRTDIEVLAPENRLSLVELASFLNMNRAEISDWIEQGKIQPFSGKCIRSYIFLKDQIAKQLNLEGSND